MDLEAQLAEARAELHRRMVGQSATEIGADGYSARFSRVTLAELKSYIADLQTQIAGGATTGAIVHVWSRG